MKEYHVVSHTHWDREWYQTFEEMRLRLLDLVDGLLDIFETEPDFVFHMDAQIVCLEDYLEIRPYRKKDIEKYISEGRLLVGPWYVQNDFNLCSGEATVRNLLIGSTIAEEWGGTQRVGYAPDQFGLTGQLPQIYDNFKIKHTLAARGYRFYERAEDGSLQQKQMPVEFDWIGVDGTRMHSYNMGCWYNNSQRFPSDNEKAWKYFNVVADAMEPLSNSPVKLLMNGVDHMEPQEDLLTLLDHVQEQAGDEIVVKQSTMIECLSKIADSFEGKEKPELVGELRHGTTDLILQGTLSSRPYLKLLNMECQNRLELELEPLYTRLAELTEGKVKYPADMLDYLWKEMQKNHAHDSICGCSTDRVHQDNENRFMRILDAANDLKRRGLNHLVHRIDRDGMDEDGYLLTVVNTLPYERSEVVTAEVYPLESDNFSEFGLVDEDGNSVEFELLESAVANKCLITPCNLPGQKLVNKHLIRFSTLVAASGYRTFRLERTEEVISIPMSCAWNDGVAENEHIRVTVTAEGLVSLLDRETGEEYDNLLSFEDVSDIGESYWFTPGSEPGPLDCSVPPIVSVDGNKLMLSYAFGVTLALTLDKGDRNLGIEAEVVNSEINHRLRLLVHTGVKSEYNLSSQPFDCLERSCVQQLPDLRDDWTEPNTGMVSVRSEKRQLTVLNNGIYEYEQLNDGQGTIALTLMRSTARIANDPMCCQDDLAPDPMWDAPENQCLRTVSYKLAIRVGDMNNAQLLREMQCFQVPMLPVFDAVDSRKYNEGRPYVGEVELQMSWYRLPKVDECTLPKTNSGMELDAGLVFSALKQSHDRQNRVLRFYNPTDDSVEAGLDINASVSAMDERTGGEQWSSGAKVAAKKVVTIRY